MSHLNATEGMSRLEAISVEFDDEYEKVSTYIEFAKEYKRGVKGIAVGSNLFDICADLQVDLPADIEERLTNFIRMKYDVYPPATQNVCRWYIRELYAKDLGLRPEGQSIYEPMIQMIELGGDFYGHHEDLCIGPAMLIDYFEPE